MTVSERINRALERERDREQKQANESRTNNRYRLEKAIAREKTNNTPAYQSVMDRQTAQAGGAISGPAASRSYVTYADVAQGVTEKLNTAARAMEDYYGRVEKARTAIEAEKANRSRIGKIQQIYFKNAIDDVTPEKYSLYVDGVKALTESKQRQKAAQAEYDGLVGDPVGQMILGEYNRALEEYNGFFGFKGDGTDDGSFRVGSGAAWDRWRGSIRNAESIEADLQTIAEKRKELDRTEKSLAVDRGYLANLGNNWETVYADNPTVLETARGAQRRLQEIEDNRARLDEREKALQEEMEFSQFLKWEELRENPDFESGSRYETTANGKEKKIDYLTSGPENGNGVIYDETGFDDLTYDAINGSQRARDIMASQKSSMWDVLYGEGDLLAYMTDDEKALYNYIHKTQGREAADNYLQDLRSTMTARQRENSEKEVREYAKEHPVAASLFSVLTSPAKGLSYLGQAAEYLGSGTIDQNARYNRFSYENTAIRDAVAKKIEASGKWGKAGSFLYQTGMSMGDFLTSAALGGGSDLSLAIMGTGAAADAVISAKDRGLSDGQAFTLGTVAGLAEVVTEKVSLDTLLSSRTWSKGAIGGLLANTIAEGSEEAASDLINWFADVLVAKDQSEWREAIRAYMDANPQWDEDKAFIAALEDKAAEIGLDALGGALSGGVMGSVGAISTSVNANRAGAAVNYWDESTVRGIIDEARRTGAGSDAYKMADALEKKINAGREITRADVGNLINVTARTRAEAQERERREREKAERRAARQKANTITPTEAGGVERIQEADSAASAEDNATTSGTEEIPPAPMTIEERDEAVAERKRALEERTRAFQEAMARGEDVSAVQEELMAEADDIRREEEAIARAEQEEITRRQRAAMTLPTGREIEERRERAGNLRELERSGRESGATEEQIGVARRIADATGRRIVFMNEGRNSRRGAYQSGTIYVNAAYGNETGQIIAHEMTHSIESSGSYDEFSRLVQRRIMDTGGDLDGMLREVRERYAAAGVPLDAKRGDDMKEVVAQYVERELLTSPESITSLVKENRSLGRRILDLLDSLLVKITKKEAAKERAFIRRARDLYAQALRDTRSSVDSEAALQQAREALATGEITEDEFDRIYDALGVGLDLEGGGQNSIAAPADRREVAGRLRNMLSSGASVQEIRRYVNSVSDTGTRQSPAGTRADGARQILSAAHRSNMSVDEYLRQNWDEYEVNGELRPEARRALEMEGGRTQYSISSGEIEAVQGIGRKSVNDFSTEDIEKTEAFASRYFQELGPKSPFFRAWFGDWRANDTTPIQVANERRDARGVQHNEDTGWDVQVSGKIFNETKAHKMTANRDAWDYLPYINDIVKKAVLLDSYTQGKTKSANSLMMHSLYAVADRGNGPELVKLYVEEMNDPNRRGTAKRAYQLQNIERWQPNAKGSGESPSPVNSTANIETIADLFAAVKSKDPNFNPQPASKIVDEDGRPLVVYHGTDADFTVFDRSKGRSTMDIQGSFFSPWELDAEGYGGNVRSYYLNIKNPAPEGVAYRALNRFKGQNNAGVKAREYLESLGYDGVDNSGEEYIAFSPEQIKLAEGNRGTFDRTNPDVRYSIAEGTQTDTEGQENAERDIRDTVPAKAKTVLQRAERGLVNKAGDLMQVPRFARREYLQDIARKMSREYLASGSVSQNTRDELFEEAYARGVEVDREFYDEYEGLKRRLREMPITISETDQPDVRGYDTFEQFRRAAFGTLRIVKEGATPVDTAYQDLMATYPELFPEDITHPADQIVRMFEVGRSIEISEKTLDEALGPNAEECKAWMRNDFDSAVGDMLAELRAVKRYAEERTAKAETDGAALTLEEVKEIYPKARDARKNYEKVISRNLLTAEDQRQVGRLMRGDIELSDLKAERDNVKGITEVFKAKQEYEQFARQIREWNEARRASLRDEADEYLATANGWKDKKGWQYSRETMERNIRDIVPDQKLADRIVEKYFTPVHKAAAQSTKLKNRMRDRVRALELSRKVAEGNKVSEAHAVQLLGEARDNIDYLTKAKYIRERDGKSISDWRGVVQELYETNPNMDWNKVERAIEEFRKIYDELFEMMNDSRVRNGYEPVAYRKGYFPHFQPGEGDGIIALFGKALGISTEVTALPTTINGLTHTFRPGIQWFGNALERTGFDTCYDAVEGFDKYIEGVADVIFQTENIQRLRALSSQTRYRTGDEGIRKQIDEIRANEYLEEQDKQNRIEQIHEKGRFALSNFVVELEEYTNLLANKKSRADRNLEQALGRNMYNLVKTLEGRVAANMVAVNPGSWLTNFIPLTQGGAMLDRGMLIHGMWDTLKAYKTDDGFVGQSTFLTNRRGSDPLVRTWQQSASATMSKPMEWIDNFTADSLVRARYRQNVQNRQMSEAAAMEEADAWVAGVMADRSKGSTPTIFNRSNPLTKLFTQFQLEVNNQISYVCKDMPRGFKEKGLGALALALFKFALGAWLYDEVYEYFIGRRPALDPIGMLNDTVGDLTGWELPNLVSLGVGAVTGDVPSFETGKAGIGQAGLNLFKNVAEETPFVGGLMGGGRLPISSALPDVEKLWGAATNSGQSGRKRWNTAVKEIGKPLTYLLLPFGGGQMKKILEGVSAVVKGGSYTVDAQGRDIMQYPIYNDSVIETAWNVAKASLFGKSSFQGAQRWVDSEFKNYSAKATGAYQGLTQAGVRGRDADDLVIALTGAEETDGKSKKEVQIELLRSSKIPEDMKIIPYYALMASEKEIELIDELAENGAAGDLLNMLMGYDEAEKLKEGKSDAQRKAVFDSKLTDREKITAIGILEPSSSYTAFKMQTAQDYGIGMDDYYAAIYGARDTDGDGKVTQKEKIAAIRALNLSNEKKAVLYQLADSRWKPNKNPFATGVGQEVYDLVQEEKARRENSGEEEEDEENGKARWEGGRLVLPKW